MSRLRLLLAWLIMAALPLQGFAAASMLLCSGAHPMKVAQGSPRAAQHADAASAGHDHAKHSHAVEAEPAQAADSAKPLPDASHKCGACASCCHSLAIAGFVGWPDFAPLPQAGSAEPFVLIDTPFPQLPDKPPRA